MRLRKLPLLFAVPLLFPPLDASDGPSKAGEFVVWCKDHTGPCADRIGSVEDALVSKPDQRYCAPKDGNITDGIAKVQAWLGAHSEINTRDTDAAITEAWIALYPCRA
jgi:hypothetical protein